MPITQPGIIPVYCNIHPKMEAYIIAVKTPYFAITDENGAFSIDNVPPGKYTMKIWHERAKPEVLDELSRTIRVHKVNTNLGTISIDEKEFVHTPHKNKNGVDYPATENKAN